METKIQRMEWLKLLICLVFVMVNTQVDADAGKVTQIGGLKCYVSGPTNSKKSVILSSDVFGYTIPHLRQIADKVGAAGFFAVVPDYFKGDAFIANVTNKTEWNNRHQPFKAIKDAKPLVKALLRKGIVKIGVAGFCWGGKVTVDLTKSHHVRAVVLLHPTGVNVTDIEGVKIPISFLGGQNDPTATPALLKQFQLAFKAKRPKVDSYLEIFAGAGHGWTTKYNDTDAPAVVRAEKAHQAMLNWFNKYLN